MAAVSRVNSVVILVGADGSEKLINKRTADIVVARATLIMVLLDEVRQTPNVELVTGNAIIGLSRLEASKQGEAPVAEAPAPLVVRLESGRLLHASHVVGADGKHSCVRSAARALSLIEGRGPVPFAWEEHEEVAWGIYIEVEALPTRFRRDATFVFRSAFSMGTMLATATPLPGGRCATYVILYDEILAEHPWMRPTATAGGEASSNAAHDHDGGPTDPTWRRNFSTLLRVHMPEYAQAIGGADVDGEALRGAVINRRASWIEITSGRYDALDGQVRALP